jgi:hypothetical protein
MKDYISYGPDESCHQLEIYLYHTKIFNNFNKSTLISINFYFSLFGVYTILSKSHNRPQGYDILMLTIFAPQLCFPAATDWWPSCIISASEGIYMGFKQIIDPAFWLYTICKFVILTICT